MNRACRIPGSLRLRCYYEPQLIQLDFCDLCISETHEIYKASPYSIAINEYIRNIGDLMFYLGLELIEGVVAGRPCLIRHDLSPDQVDCHTGLTNRELIALGRIPVDPASSCRKVHLHHIGQKPDSPFAELTTDEDVSFRGNPIHYSEDSVIDRRKFAKERKIHWQARWLHMRKD